jgi:hypothetical protein
MKLSSLNCKKEIKIHHRKRENSYKNFVVKKQAVIKPVRYKRSTTSEFTKLNCCCTINENFFHVIFLQINLDGVLPVTKYNSKLTGLTVVFAQAESPIVNGYFCLPTEAYDDDGLPHTLEHLIFLGRYSQWSISPTFYERICANILRYKSSNL